jgi:alanine dehydrogenase
MLIGALKEIKRLEFRVAVTPAGVETLRTPYGPGPR